MPIGFEKPVWIWTSWGNGGALSEAPGSRMVRAGPASTSGGSFAFRTTTVRLSEAENIPSLALRLRTYVPASVNVAVVATDAGSANTTGAGPLDDHTVESAGGAGRPSSLAVPESETLFTGRRISWSGPASTS